MLSECDPSQKCSMPECDKRFSLFFLQSGNVFRLCLEHFERAVPLIGLRKTVCNHYGSEPQ